MNNTMTIWESEPEIDLRQSVTEPWRVFPGVTMTIFDASLPAGEECELKMSTGVNLASASVQWRLYDLATNDDMIAATLGDGIDILSAADGILGVTFDTTGLAGSYGHECTVDGQSIMTGVLTIE